MAPKYEKASSKESEPFPLDHTPVVNKALDVLGLSTVYGNIEKRLTGSETDKLAVQNMDLDFRPKDTLESKEKAERSSFIFYKFVL